MLLALQHSSAFLINCNNAKCENLVGKSMSTRILKKLISPVDSNPLNAFLAQQQYNFGIGFEEKYN
jgi:hypothetical protein